MKNIIIAIVVIVGLSIILGQAVSPENTSKTVQPYQAQVANDFEEQYNQVKLHGTMIDRCVRAGLVAEGYLQAKDNVNFAKWVEIKSKDCKAAGVPQ